MKKTLSILLVLVLTLCTAIPTLASGSEKRINGMTGSLTMGYHGDTWLGEINPQENRTVYIPLTDSMFAWDGDHNVATPGNLTGAQIRNARLTARSNANRNVVSDISINSRESRIEVTFAPELVKVKEIEFDFEVYLTVNGHSYRNNGISFSGTFANPVVEVYANDEIVDISDGTVAEAQEYIKSLDLEIGHGVTVKTRLSKDMRVYGTTTRTPDDADEDMFKENPAIDGVITMQTVGLDRSTNTVSLDGEYRNYHIYDADLAYLGVGRDALPFASKYYLATEIIEFDDEYGEDEPEWGDDIMDKEPEYVNDADVSQPNVNNNPKTGR